METRHHPHNLPNPPTSFVGREHELFEAVRLLDTTRLLTLIGVGGCGKTRLALQVAIRQTDVFEDGVCWVDLVGLSESALVTQSVAQALDLREASRESLLETLTNYLKAKRLLLVLDNCEHLLAACRELVDALLRACPLLKVLTTSREPLAIAGELTWLVPALSLPDVTRLPQHDHHLAAEFGRYDAIRLFVERAQAVLPTFTLTNQNAMAVTQVCQRLDGMPLAIELAAARVNVLAVQQIAQRLDDRFALLAGGNRTALIPRHQTLRATMDWSYDLLSESERILFRRLSVFAGGFGIEAAEEIGAGDGLRQNNILDLLSHLIDKSLVVADTQQRNEARYHLLETIRQYASDKLHEAGEADTVRDRHLEFFIQFAETAETQLGGAEQVQWLDRLEPDHDNFRAALKWSEESGRAMIGLRLAVALLSFWCVRGSYSEGWQYFAALLARPESLERTAARAKALTVAADLLPWGPSNYATALALLQESLAIGQEVGDRSAIAGSLSLLSLAALSRDDYAAAQAFAEEAVPMWHELGNETGIALVHAYLGDALTYQGNDEQAQAYYEESLTRFTELRDKNLMAYVFRRKGLAALHHGANLKAAELCGESLALNQEIGSYSGIVASIAALAAVGAARGKMAYATRLLGVVETSLVSGNVQIMALDRSQFDRTVAIAHAQLREATFAQAWAEGQAMTLEQAVGEAMNVASPSKEMSVHGSMLVEPLNERELEMLQLIAEGLSNHEIAERLVISLSTVKWHVSNLFGKLGVSSRTQALARAKELGSL
jgi:predicted ATPase/DNA-binding CsgD family transcriptional regulator